MRDNKESVGRGYREQEATGDTTNDNAESGVIFCRDQGPAKRGRATQWRAEAEAVGTKGPQRDDDARQYRERGLEALGIKGPQRVDARQ